MYRLYTVTVNPIPQGNSQGVVVCETEDGAEAKWLKHALTRMIDTERAWVWLSVETRNRGRLLIENIE